MALQYSSKIVTDNLVMCLDASQNKSYPTTDVPVKSGLLLWLDAADDSTFSYSSGTVVSQWRDKSGNNFHAFQSTTTQQPSRNTTNNSRKSVFFNAASRLDYMKITSGILLPNDASIFIIYKPSTQIYNYAVLIDNYHGLGGAYGFVIQRVNNLSQFYYANGDGSNFVDASASPWTYTDGTIQLLSLNKSSSTATPYTSGTAQTSRTVYANTAQYTTALSIGAWQEGGRFYNGDMCEILIFNRSLNSNEMKQVHTYLGQKWGILNTDRSIIDLSGNNDNGLLGNGTTANIPSYDFYNKSLRFDGTNDYVFLTNSQLNISSTITVETWVKYNAQGGYNGRSYSVITCKGYPWTWLLEDQSGQYNFRISTSVTADSNVNSSYSHGLNLWNHVVGTYDGSTQRIYVDGILRSSTALTGTINTSSNDALVGSFNYGDYCLTGHVGVLRVYSRALSASEIVQNYNAQKSRFIQTLVQQGMTLSLDAGNPDSYAGAGFSWYDVSGNSYICTLINGPTYSNGAIVFDGTNDFVDLTYPYSVPIAASGNAVRSMFAWVRTTSTGNQAFISTGTAANSQSFNLVKYGSYIGIMGYNNDYYPSTGNAGILITDGVWHYIGVTFDGTNLRMYVDGILDNTSGTLTYSTTGQNNFIGKSSHTGNENYTNGSMGMVHVYNRALSGAEVLQNYNATKGRFGR